MENSNVTIECGFKLVAKTVRNEYEITSSILNLIPLTAKTLENGCLSCFMHVPKEFVLEVMAVGLEFSEEIIC